MHQFGLKEVGNSKNIINWLIASLKSLYSREKIDAKDTKRKKKKKKKKNEESSEEPEPEENKKNLRFARTFYG